MIRLVHVFTVPDSLLFIGGQVRFMRERGYDVTVISSPGPKLDAFSARESVAVHGVEMPRSITPAKDLASVARLAKTLAQLRPDIVHAHTPKGGLLGMLAATTARTPIRVYQMHGLPLMTATEPLRTVLTNCERVSCGLAHRVICDSHSLNAIARTRRLCSTSKIEVLLSGSANGVDTKERFNPDRVPADARSSARAQLGIEASAVVFGFVGRLVGDKGVAELAHAWQRVRALHASAQLLIVGHYEERDSVPDQVRRMLEGDRSVHMLGFRDDTPSLYAAMDVLVLPTYREGFPNVLLEAASMRLPVVSTRVEGCVDAVEDGVTGTLVPARDAESLADALIAYAGNSELRSRHGQAARRRVLATFDSELVWTAQADFYARLLRQQQRRPS